MTSAEKFHEAEILFNRLLETPKGERDVLLKRTTGEDIELRKLVERMVAREESGAHQSRIGGSLTDLDESEDMHPGDSIGPYTIDRKVGEGGMGIVYDARQTEPVARRVALKLIKRGMDTNQILARFETERRLLARMQHANIAVLYDAGKSDDGRPYFAMEFVDGQPIDQYCDQEKMSIDDRLRLLLSVCNGVQHAHQKGVIHRDLKPANVHVYGGAKGPRAKIIDFGIAKLTDPDTSDSMTRIGQVVGTPEYMSPEQLAADETGIDTRADVYALGVILFELLSGTLPASGSGKSALSRPSLAVRQGTNIQNAARDRSTSAARLVRALSGDLDWIVMKAIHEDRDRRYDSAAALARDICCYLDGQPVMAGPDSPAYRLRRFVGRHRALAASAAVAVISLAIAAVASTYFAIDAARARDVAEREARVAREVATFLNRDILAQGNPYKNNDRELTIIDAVDRAGEALEDRFEDQPIVKANIYVTLGDTYAGLIQTPKALSAYSNAVTLFESAGDRSVLYFKSLLGLAGEHTYSGGFRDAESNLRKLLAADETELPAGHELRLQAMNTLAYVYDSESNDVAAIAIYESAVAAHRIALGEDDRETLTVKNNLGLAYGEAGNLERARSLLDEVATTRARVLGADDPDSILSMLSLGYILTEQGDLAQAEGVILSCIDIAREALGDEHPMYLWGFGLLGDLYRKQEKYADAERLYGDALDAQRENLGRSHTLTLDIQRRLAVLLLDQEKFDEATPLYEEIVTARIESSGVDSSHALEAIAGLVQSLRGEGRCEEANQWTQRSLPAARSAFDSTDRNLVALENTSSCQSTD